MKSKIRFDRLQKLADHLMSGELGHDYFDFGVYSRGARKLNSCGTSGCAIGECPVVFNRSWAFKKGYPHLIRNSALSVGNDAKKFFGIEYKMYQHLFEPSYITNPYAHQAPSRFGGKILYANATRKAVAKNILAFIKKVQTVKS